MPPIICAYDFTDALKNISPNNQGANDGLVFLKTFRKILVTHQSEPEVSNFLTFWYNSVQQFNFYQLYNSPFLKPLDDGYRAVIFQGHHQVNHFQLALPSETGEKIPVSQLGDFKLSFGLKQNNLCITGDRSYSGYMDIQMALKQFSYKTLAAMLEGLITVIDPDNLASLNPKKSQRFEEIDGFSRKAIDVFDETYPRFQKFLDEYFILHSAMEEKRYKFVPYTHFKLIVEFDFKNLKKDFPHLTYQLKRLESLFQFKLSFQNKNGNHILDIFLDSQDTFLQLDYYTHQGKVIPFSPDGTPVFEEAFYPTKVKNYDFNMNVDIFFNIYGMKFRTENIKIDCVYQSREKFGKIKFMLKEIPKTRVSGRAYHIVPTWFIDIMIPGNIDQLIDNFCKVLISANNSEGSYLRLLWDTRNPNDVFLYPHASSEFIDNFFILFGFQIWHEKFKMSDEAASDLNQLNVRGMEALILDISNQL
jgi:hypothetical protein